MTNSDFAIATLSGTANVETKVGTIAVAGGARIKQITIANRTGVGTIWAVRLDYAGIKTPKKFIIPASYDQTGTEAAVNGLWPVETIDVDIQIPSNTSTIDVYATGNQVSTTVAVGLVWV